MRLLRVAGPVVVILFSFVSFILCFLCIFAGHKPGFMEDYSILALNTSRVGQAYVEQTIKNLTQNGGSELSGILKEVDIKPTQVQERGLLPTLSIPGLSLPTSTSNPLTSIFHNITSILGDNPLTSQFTNPNSPLNNFLTGTTGFNLTQAINQTLQHGLDEFAGSIADIIGISDFYSVHLLNYCQGKLLPGPIPNATFPASKIHRQVTNCSKQLGLANFSPNAAFANSLLQSNTGISLSTLNLTGGSSSNSSTGAGFNSAFTSLNGALKSTLVFYIMALIFNFFSICAAIWWLIDQEDPRLRRPLVTNICTSTANGFLFTPSLTATIIGTLAKKYIVQAAGSLKVAALPGTGFLGLTWSAFVCSLIAAVPPAVATMRAVGRKWKARKERRRQRRQMVGVGEEKGSGSGPEYA
ncbi:hypothetical protein BT63DRAFT_429655 [Microthyrium microscopicum]|uniref:Uncharacterized protein n=1 Tax=Microthyrium microscopicum TaxID=703497 RepID=A0A6A6TZ29_9PEZI|nr:hypothetical protein BT63DRAFT_429655 [Microthyrium microscopicum]